MVQFFRNQSARSSSSFFAFSLSNSTFWKWSSCRLVGREEWITEQVNNYSDDSGLQKCENSSIQEKTKWPLKISIVIITQIKENYFLCLVSHFPWTINSKEVQLEPLSIHWIRNFWINSIGKRLFQILSRMRLKLMLLQPFMMVILATI